MPKQQLEEQFISPINQPDKKPFNFWLVIIIVLATALITGGVIYAFGRQEIRRIVQEFKKQNNQLQEQIEKLKQTAKKDEFADWQTYTNAQLGITFNYPKSWSVAEEINDEIFIGDGNTYFPNPYIIKIASFDKLRNDFEKLWQEDCPANCAGLKNDKKLFEQQFDILKKIGQGVTSEDFKKDIKDNFIIFSGGRDYRLLINFGSTPGINYVRIVGTDGFDTGLDNFYYKFVLVKEEKVAVLTFSLFNFEDPNKYIPKMSSEDDYFNMILNDLPDFITSQSDKLGFIEDQDKELVKNKIKTYNQILSTFQFTD